MPSPASEPSLPAPPTGLPDDLRTLYTGADGHLYLAEGDGRSTTRLTWSEEDFASVAGVPMLPGVLGELEDGFVFAHAAPSPDGERVAVFGLLPTMSEEDHGNDADTLEDDASDPWDAQPEGDDTAGPGVLFAVMSEDGETVLKAGLTEDENPFETQGGDGDGGGEEDCEPAPEDGEPGEAEEPDTDEQADGDTLEDVEPDSGYWPGGKVYVLHRDGVRIWESFTLDHGSPTHLEWSPDGRLLLVLHQHGDSLSLHAVDPEARREPELLAKGAPLFWGWRPQADLLAARVTDPDTQVARVRLFAPGTDTPARTLAEAGAFYAPEFSPDGRMLAYGKSGDREDRLVVSQADGTGERLLLGYPGRAGFRFSRDSARLAVGIAPEGSGHFEVLDIVDVATGKANTVRRASMLAWEWLPGDEALLVCETDASGQRLQWVRVGTDGSARPVGAAFRPSREAFVGLHFFEQVARSHPFVAADGRHVVMSGAPLGDIVDAGPGDDPDDEPWEAEDGFPPRVLVAAIAGGPSVAIGSGRFACFAPRG